MEVAEYTKSGSKPDWIKIKTVEQLSVTVREQGKGNVLKFIIMALKGLNSSINVVRPLTDEQIIEIAADLMEDYYFFRLVDFSICFKNIRKGLYGKIMDRLDEETLYGMIQKYDSIRALEIQKYNQSLQGKQNRTQRSCFSGDTLQDQFNAVKKKLK